MLLTMGWGDSGGMRESSTLTKSKQRWSLFSPPPTLTIIIYKSTLHKTVFKKFFLFYLFLENITFKNMITVCDGVIYYLDF